MFLLMSILGCGDGKSTVTSSSTAPFDLSEIKATLWGVGPDNDEEEGVALLVLSNKGLSCSDLSSTPIGDDLEFDSLFEFIDQGSGLMFMMEYDGYSSDDVEPGDADASSYEGLWTAAMYKTLGDGGTMSRSLYALGFSEGFVFLIDGYYGLFGSETWLYVDGLNDDTVSGSYNTLWWSGSYTGEYCGAWQDDSDRDSWWDSW